MNARPSARSIRQSASIDSTTAQNLENLMNAKPVTRTTRNANAAAEKATMASTVKKAATEAAATVTKATKPRAPRKAKVAADPITPANLKRLAAASKRVADKLVVEMDKLTDPRMATIAAKKALAAMEVANERAENAGLPIPFDDDSQHAAHDEAFGARDDSPNNVGPHADDMPDDEATSLEEEIALENALKMEAEDAAKLAKPVKRPTKAAIAKAAKAAEAAKATEAAEPLNMPLALDETVKVLTARQKALMAAIGNREFSFFDGGIVANEGIWHANLTDEAAGGTSPIASTPHGVANVVAALGRKGLLNICDNGADGVWVSLTESGAALANSLAATAPAPEPKPAPAKKTAKKAVPAKMTKAAIAKEAKAVVDADPAKNPKVLALVAYAETQGWDVHTETNGAVVTVVAAREDELLTTTFVDGKLDLTTMPTFARVDGSVVMLRNVSAVKKQMDSDPSARPVKAVRPTTTRKAVAAIDGAEDAPQRSLPFNPAEASDEEVAETLSGAVLRWRRADGGIETAIAGKKVTVKAHPRKAGKVNRLISFFEMVESEKHGAIAGGERHVGLDRLLTVGN